tara:strand:- start:252 stop:1478 length:1227 start_codon:yes stop_codon:yes gene_type:complete
MEPDNKAKDKKVSFDLNIHVARLLLSEPFFAALSRRVDKRASQAIPTAAVLVNPMSGQFEMLYNPDFFEPLNDDQRRDIIKHELYHLIFEHLTGRRPDGENPRIWNFATDLAINSHLRNLPEGCLMPGEGVFKDYPRGKSSEWYLAKLKENEFDPDKGEGEGEGEGEGKGKGGSKLGDNGQFDSHEHWDDAPSTVKEIAKERLKNTLRKATEEVSRNSSWGSVPSEVRQDIMKRLSGMVDWKKVLRYFVKTSQRANKSTSIKRINRRYPYIHPGRKTSRTAKIAISIDQSGSVDDGMLAKFFAELNKLSDIAEFTVVPFDTSVAEDKVFVWKKGEKRKWERVRCGGTDFNPPTDYVNERSFDGHILLTDLCAPKPKASKCQRMWLTTEYYARNPYFQTSERVIAITEV